MASRHATAGIASIIGSSNRLPLFSFGGIAAPQSSQGTAPQFGVVATPRLPMSRLPPHRDVDRWRWRLLTGRAVGLHMHGKPTPASFSAFLDAAAHMRRMK
jgi:hypothetical protein